MKKIILIFVLWEFINILLAFNPLRDNFIDDYHYNLFVSWIKFGDFPVNNPAFLSKDEIISSYRNSKGETATISFKLDKELIFELSEVCKNHSHSDKNWSDFQNKIEKLLFRLNTESSKYAFDFLKNNNILLKYGGLQSQLAIDEIRRKGKRISFLEISIDEPNLIEIKTNIGKIILILDTSQKSIFRFKKSGKKKDRFEKGNKESKEKTKNINDRDLTQLEEYFEIHKSDKIYNQIMNNRIKSIKDFVAKNFQDKLNVSYQNKKVTIKRKKYLDFSADISFLFETDENGYYIFPNVNYKILKDRIIIVQDTIAYSHIRLSEIKKIIPSISEMILLHRSLGSSLFNFLIHNDQADTFLIINGGKRKTYHFDNYSSLLLLLNKYWGNRTVYYKILNVKKVNNYIEFESSLISKDSKVSDFATIKIKLDDNFKVDLIQVSIFPEIKK